MKFLLSSLSSVLTDIQQIQAYILLIVRQNNLCLSLLCYSVDIDQVQHYQSTGHVVRALFYYDHKLLFHFSEGSCHTLGNVDEN